MSLPGDHDADMALNWQVGDDVVEAIIRNEAVDDALAPLALFARSVQAAGEQPPPQPSGELAELLAGHQQPHPSGLRPVADVSSATKGASATGRARGSKRRYRVPLAIAALGGKVASLGLAGKAAAATGAVTLGTLTAGAAGVAPAPVTDAVQSAITTVTPLNLGDTDDVDAGVDVGNTGSVGASVDADSGVTADVGADADDVTGTATDAVGGATATATDAVGGAVGTAEGTANDAVGGVLDTANDVPVAGEVLPDEVEVPPLPGAPAAPVVPGLPGAEAGASAEASR